MKLLKTKNAKIILSIIIIDLIMLVLTALFAPQLGPLVTRIGIGLFGLLGLYQLVTEWQQGWTVRIINLVVLAFYSWLFW